MGVTMILDLLATADNLCVLIPRPQPRPSTRDLFILVIVITSAILLLVEGVLIYVLIQNRRRSGPTDLQPPQVYNGSKPIEVAWTAAPFLIVFVLFLLTARVLWEGPR